MKRAAGIIFGIVSSLFFLLAGIGWLTSDESLLGFRWASGSRHYHVDSFIGVLRVEWMHHPNIASLPGIMSSRGFRLNVEPGSSPEEVLADFGMPRPNPTKVRGVTIFSGDFKKYDPNSNWSYHIIYINWWLITTICAALWGTWLALHLRDRRRRKLAKKGLCERCGYDLRATPDAGGAILARCPECGECSAKVVSQ